MDTIKKRTFTIIVALLLAFAMMPLVPYDAGRVFAESFVIPTAADDDTYTADNNWNGTLEINESKTIKLRGISHINNEAGTGPAIKIEGNSTVNLVFEGDNVLSCNEVDTCAGIEVEEGSTVNIYGIDGATLTVTGGKYGAGIGGIGFRSAEKNNPLAGNINIYSGTITAIGGDCGAGIGSGQHSSASDINIYGGDITALGTGCGAGIGSGYGTSGGANAYGAGVGTYNGGDITISGGKVFAAAYHINRNDLDIYDTDSLYIEGYDSMAAGIGGGYAASSGNIVIEGDAEVTAIGGCGGAGVGSGRGTSDRNKYDEEKYDCNVTIRGNAKVNALTTDDRRSRTTGDDGAAAIGHGRGCTLGEPKGTVTITGNAEVYAVGASHAAAIGGSTVVGKYESIPDGTILRPENAHLENLTIGNSATVTAVSDGYRPAVDLEPSGFISLKADQQYFENRGDFYTEDKFPLKIGTVKAGSTSAKSTFAVQSPEAVNVMVHMPNIDKSSFIIEDHQGNNGERIYLSNAIEDNSAQFMTGSEYDLYGLTSRLDSNASVDSQYGNVDVKIQAAEGIFEYGSTFLAGPAGDDAAANLDKSYSDKLDKVLFFDIGVKDRAGANYAEYEGGKPVISIQLPNGWDKSRTQALLVNAGSDKSFAGSQKITTSGGKTYVSFETTRGGTFALLEQKGDPTPKPTPTPTPSKVSGTPLAKMTAKGKNSLVLKWNKVNGAEGYDIFFVRCGDNDSLKKVKTIKGNKTLKWTKKGLRKKTAYKAVVKAWIKKGGKKTYVKISPAVHAYTSGGKKYFTNPEKVTVNKPKVSLKKGKTFKIEASVTGLQKGKALIPDCHEPELRYISSNKKIATVSKSGKITAKSKGKCKVYVLAINGVSKAVTVTVK